MSPSLASARSVPTGETGKAGSRPVRRTYDASGTGTGGSGPT
jgi:hypothetical protein